MVNVFDTEFGKVVRSLTLEEMVRKEKTREFIDLVSAHALVQTLQRADDVQSILALEGLRSRLFYFNVYILGLIDDWQRRQNPGTEFDDIGDTLKRKKWRKENSIIDRGTDAIYSLTSEEVTQLRKLQTEYQTLYLSLCEILLAKNTNFPLEDEKSVGVE